MSTTTEQAVAMGYASDGRGAKASMGIVIEVQQGMVNRGADISRLSQYPHEREILCARTTSSLMRQPVPNCISMRSRRCALALCILTRTIA